MNKLNTARKTVWVCTACGKFAQNMHGKGCLGWDVSCSIHSKECYYDKLVFNSDKTKVIKILDHGIKQ